MSTDQEVHIATSVAALRLHDKLTSKSVIVQGDRVYADLDGDRRIAKDEEAGVSVLGPRRDALMQAARHIEQFCDTRVPGVTTSDGTIVSGAKLNAAEQAEFESAEGTAERRPPLREHLSFFDRKNRGKITLGDNYWGWRRLGFGVLKSLVQAMQSAAVFGGRRGGTIKIAEIGRPHGATGIYDVNGNIDDAKWAQFLAAFENVAKGGVLTQDQARTVLAEQVRLGRVPKKQFDSLFGVCEKMNRAKTITIDELGWLYDGSLLYRAASMTDDGGRRKL